MKKNILVAPLNWGLGHATRCIPIIQALKTNGFEPMIASDGVALELLKKEFPDITSFELPSYHIKYSKKGTFFRLQLLKDSPKMLSAISAERKAVKKIIESHDIGGLISDNRFGVYHKKIPCVFITHQLRVLSGSTTWLSSRMHQKIISQYDECWVPDAVGSPNLSGKLGHVSIPNITIKYMGPLSRFTKKELEMRNDIMVLLSGPEPQRSLLEEKLFSEFKFFDGKVLFVKGIVENEQKTVQNGSMTVCNYLVGKDLETALNESQLIVSRSGYTTIMDLAKLGKKAFFIPTPGQFEQEYLANRLMEDGLVPSCKQSDFTIEKLKEASNYGGLEAFDFQFNSKRLFQLFKSE
ncbi:MAG TPA: glycosyltransferase [Aquaticitalea sp.]|nr:glycosyltransferase [Aquaticitalea sp.]